MAHIDISGNRQGADIIGWLAAEVDLSGTSDISVLIQLLKFFAC